MQTLPKNETQYYVSNISNTTSKLTNCIKLRRHENKKKEPSGLACFGAQCPDFDVLCCCYVFLSRRCIGPLRAAGPFAPVGGRVSSIFISTTWRREGSGRPGGLWCHPGRPELWQLFFRCAELWNQCISNHFLSFITGPHRNTRQESVLSISRGMWSPSHLTVRDIIIKY